MLRRLFILAIAVVLLFLPLMSFERSIVDYAGKENDRLMQESRYALFHRGAPEDQIEILARAVTNACKTANRQITPALVVCLIETESGFKGNVVSPEGYRGLMQTPWASIKWPDVDILLGVRILEDKMRITNNNLPRALALYKGGTSHLAQRHARETLRIYHDLLKVKT